MSNNKKIIAIIALLAALFAVIPCIFFMNQQIKFTLNEDYYQFSNQKIPYTKDTVLLNEEGIVREENDNVLMQTTPLYAEGKKAIVTTTTYACVFYQKNESYKLEPFANLYGKDFLTYATIDGKEKELSQCFLFDGVSQYLFLHETTLQIQHQEIIVSPLSYVLIEEGKLHLYDYQNNTQQTMKVNGDILVHFSDNEVLNLATNTLTTRDSKKLLYGKPDSLHNLP